MNVLNTHSWKRDIMGVLDCIAIPERDMAPLQQSISFRGPPEHIWTYLTNSDEREKRFSTPSVVMIANILRGMSHPDQDLTMVILMYLIQTGLGLEGQLRALYAHMMSMSETARNQEVAIENLSRRFNEDLSNPSTATATSLQSMVTMEAQTVALEKEKKDVEDRFEKYKKAFPRKNSAEENSMLDARVRNKKLMEDLTKVLILTQEELTSTKKELTFSESALKLLQGRAKDSDAEDAEMEDSDSDFHAGISRARREIDFLKGSSDNLSMQLTIWQTDSMRR